MYTWFQLDGIALLRLLTSYNKVQEGLQDKDVALIVRVETRKSGKLTTLLGYYVQLKYLTAAACLAFLILLSSVITAICDRIDPDNFHGSARIHPRITCIRTCGFFTFKNSNLYPAIFYNRVTCIWGIRPAGNCHLQVPAVQSIIKNCGTMFLQGIDQTFLQNSFSRSGEMSQILMYLK
ncbi:hypothetical protein K435DRAFT_888851 [Dendrothele bispora CBS 962.96]|uniref:Uncharacterized protein n=1 Tax=Dendrothele bispora (strain CBS 962.96) TaxID=1314807 RepID=A0A4S8M5D8_DENBC|nr:hypothetical protein K435DRAFT_888851 [Dendrothele bispora CBS 962.96]